MIACPCGILSYAYHFSIMIADVNEAWAFLTRIKKYPVNNENNPRMQEGGKFAVMFYIL